MKIIAVILISSFLLTSCNLTLGEIVALDNATNSGEKIIENYKDLKPNQKIKIEFSNKTEIPDIFISINKVNGENQILIRDGKSRTDTFKINEISKIYSLNEGGSVLTAVAIGAVVDIIIIYIINSRINFGMTFFY